MKVDFSRMRSSLRSNFESEMLLLISQFKETEVLLSNHLWKNCFFLTIQNYEKWVNLTCSIIAMYTHAQLS